VIKETDMKNILFYSVALACLFAAQLFITGCAGTSAPSRFYTLHALGDEYAQRSSPASEHSLSVAVGPVEIPDYLDRPQIVTRSGPNELKLAQFDRWAGSLRDDIVRVLSQNLTLLLSRNGVSVSSWESSAAGDYRIALYIRRFDIMSDGKVLINAQWNIIGKNGVGILLTGESLAEEPIADGTYSAKAAAMSRALGRLSRDIAGGLRSIFEKNST
jgi:uncharacterized lipoprotein YmbA